MSVQPVVASSLRGIAQSSPSKPRRRRRRSASPSSPPSTRVYVIPTANDVVRGRGGKANIHPGNKTLLKIVRPLATEYRKLKRGQKGRMSSDVVHEVHASGGRFLDSREKDSLGNVLYSVMDLPSSIKLVEQKFRDDPKKRSLTRQTTGKGTDEKNRDKASKSIAIASKEPKSKVEKPLSKAVESLDTFPTSEPPNSTSEKEIHKISPSNSFVDLLNIRQSSEVCFDIDDFSFSLNDVPDLPLDSDDWLNAFNTDLPCCSEEVLFPVYM